MDIQNIYNLLDRFESSTLVELEMTFEGASLHMRKSESQVQPVVDNPMPYQKAETAMPTVEVQEVDHKTYKELKAPLAGTFYRAASPDAAPFVEKGQMVRKGDTIGIIEAMKLMNEVTAAEDGKIEEILAEDGMLVAYNEVLMRYV